MNADDVEIWLGNQLRSLVQIPSDNYGRFDAGKELVDKTIEYLRKLSPGDRSQFQEAIMASYVTRTIGNYRIPYDIRDDADTIEAILATLQDISEDFRG
jgi:hypothetical protein